MDKFWNVPASETAAILKADLERGLSETEAAQRLSLYGRNSFEAPKRSPRLKIFLRQFVSPLILILIVAAIVTVLIGHYRDAVFILVAVVVNTILGFYQENKAERALSELETYIKQRSRVIRDGKERDIDTEELVPGDLVRLSQGDRVPADARTVFVNDLQTDEAVLTGESLPVAKSTEVSPAEAVLGDQTSMVFAGTLVTQGIGTVLVCRTDRQTELGKIATLIASTEHEETPLQKAIRSFSLRMSFLLGGLTVIVFAVGLLVGHPVTEMFLTSVAIAVSAIPEGLPVALTVILSIGVQRMARRKGVVRKLVAAETLGSTTIILTDKTGTLTMARMELTDIMPFDGMEEKDLLRRALSSGNVVIENPNDPPVSWRMNGKIMETALVRGSAQRGVRTSDPEAYTAIQSAPFNAARKFAVSLAKKNDGHMLLFFGAPDILLALSTIPSEERSALLKHIHELALTGKRVLGIAHKDMEPGPDFSLAGDPEFSGITLDGLVAFHDPVRPEVKDAIARVEQAGIRTVIMTGDHAGTAEAVAREVGFTLGAGSILDASELRDMPEEVLKARLPALRVISRVTPSDKLRIAKLYQSAGEVVAMTGDGVNDAPSIKQADVGIAMGSGTEVSRSVADLVLLDDNFETIVAAVEEGRQIMGNIRKVLVYLLSNVTDGLILIGGSLLAGLALPLNALQILWVNFFSDSFPAIAFAFERESGALYAKPRKRGRSLFDPLMKFLILTIGLSTSLLLFVIYILLLRTDFDEQLVRTFIFACFGSYTLFVALSVKSLEKSIFSYSLFSNRYLVGGIAAGLVLMALAIYVPFLQYLFDTVSLPWQWVLAVVGLGVFNIATIEFGKWVFRKRTGYVSSR